MEVAGRTGGNCLTCITVTAFIRDITDRGTGANDGTPK